METPVLCYRCGTYSPDGNRECVECAEPFSPERRRSSRRDSIEGQPSRSGADKLPFTVGQVFSDRYRLDEVVARGASGWVLKAFDQLSERDVALKILDPNLLGEEAERAHFLSVVSKSEAIHHPNLTRVVESGTDHDLVYYVMPCLEGMTLRRIIDIRVEKGQVFELREALPLLRQLAEGLEGVGRFGFHGALSPNNVLVLPDVLKITGWCHFHGLPRARFLERLRHRAGGVYLSPEARAGGAGVGAGSDVYSVALILGEMLTGVVGTREPERWKQVVESLGGSTRRLLSRAFEQSADERHGSALEFIRALSDEALGEIPLIELEVENPLEPGDDSDEEVILLELNDDDEEPAPALPDVLAPAFSGRPPRGAMAGSQRAGSVSAGRSGWGASAGRMFAMTLCLGVFGVLMVTLWHGETSAVEVRNPASLTTAGNEAALGRTLAPRSEGVRKPASIERGAGAGYKREALKPALKPAAQQTVKTARASSRTPSRSKCPRGMIPIKPGKFVFGSAADDPMRGFGDRAAASVSGGAFCVDVYEYPNRRGRNPGVHVNWTQARNLCLKRGRRLCTEQEWERACKGPAGMRYSTGHEVPSGDCNVSDPENPRVPGAIGAFKKCRSGYGVADMSGNVAEWTASSWSRSVQDRVVKGGAADQAGYTARCSARVNENRSARQANLGFRCCADPQT